MITVVEVLMRTETWLKERGITSPRLNAEMLIGKALGLERMQLYLAHDRPMSEAELDVLRPLVARRGKREPLSWITGSRGFHRIDLLVEPGVLDPRPDTETLVEAALEWIAEGEDPVYVADVGTGTGCVGLAIADARKAVRLYATDLSTDAIRVARRNVEALGLKDRAAVLQGDLLTPIPTSRPIDWVVSNPPYIRSDVLPTLEAEVSQHEPKLALDGGPDGLDVYRRLVPAAAQRARQGLLVEVGHDQAARVADLLRRAGLEDLRTWPDLAGIPRVVGGRVPRG